MNKHLTIPSRILVAFASGALLAVYFLPAWRIDLFAPQYPEGLSLYIWINKLSGDVDVINGLNHYIGMKHISAAMFPEFRFLPFVVALFIILGMLAAITGNRRLLLLYLILTVLGGILVIYDIYRWGYAYGHDLDPKAPIQVPGLTYQPPVFGHKRLLNFDAYSFPDVAGWIVAGAGSVAFLVWLFEFVRIKKLKLSLPTLSGAKFVAIFLVAGILSSCNAKPEAISFGKDACTDCKMTIMDSRFGGEIITKRGKVLKFDDLHCLVHYLKSNHLDESSIRQIVAVDGQQANHFIDVHNAAFVVTPSVPSPMGSNARAFEPGSAAIPTANDSSVKVLNWNALYNSINL
ncbi:MAG TPA: nitrous oxide reductase accessory protein NosL [Chitinophagaceae bacterium]|nr:nitrous oxide reductase accessory protein NosL [Chitinophagaceae bacterium]